MLTIYNTYVEIKSEKQFNRLVMACKIKRLEVLEYSLDRNYFHCNCSKSFSNWIIPLINQTKVTEQQFLKLLEEHGKTT